jgi:phage terminase small subunit
MDCNPTSHQEPQPVRRELTIRQTLFVAEYLIDHNATRAAIAAGYSKRGARVRGAELLANRNVSEEISRRTSERMNKLEIRTDRVLKELARIAFFDPRKLFKADGSLRQVNELDEDTAAAIASLEVRELFQAIGSDKHPYGRVGKYKFANKRGALELLGKHLNLFSGKPGLFGADGKPVLPPQIIVNFIDPEDIRAEQTKPGSDSGFPESERPAVPVTTASFSN